MYSFCYIRQTSLDSSCAGVSVPSDPTNGLGVFSKCHEVVLSFGINIKRV